MASIAALPSPITYDNVSLVQWSLEGGDTGKPVNVSAFPDKTWQVTGTFGSVTLRGSNMVSPDDTNSAHWLDLTNPQGSALTLAAAGGGLVAENPLWISPITTGGSGYSISVVGKR